MTPKVGISSANVRILAVSSLVRCCRTQPFIFLPQSQEFALKIESEIFGFDNERSHGRGILASGLTDLDQLENELRNLHVAVSAVHGMLEA